MTNRQRLAIGGDLFSSEPSPLLIRSIANFKKQNHAFFALNYESTIGDKKNPNYKKVGLQTNLNQDLLRQLDLAFTANNHIFDYGIAQYEDTVQALINLGVEVVGSGIKQEAFRPANVSCAGEKYSILNICCYSSNPTNISTEDSPGIANLDFDEIIDWLSKSQDQFKILCIHWGSENRRFPAIEQVSMARYLIDMGVDCLIGCHAHVVQPCEIYRGKRIFYNIGNFYFDNYIIGEDKRSTQTRSNGLGMIILFETREPKICWVKKGQFVEADFSIKQWYDNLNQEFAEAQAKINWSQVPREPVFEYLFNGSTYQYRFKSKDIYSDPSLVYENFRAKIRRVVLNFLRKLF